MRYQTLVFDLDGTISDPKDGIVRSLNYALDQHGFEQRVEDDLLWCIGPPLDQSFSILVKGADKNLIASLVASYRERYTDVGYSENILYAGIKETLELIGQTPGTKIGLCTSKRVDFADQILKMFDLYDLFDFVNGGEIGIEKSEQLSGLLKDKVIDSKAIMIGDRSFDLVAANNNKLASAGVLWGYGSIKELKEYQPTFLFQTPGDLISLISPVSSNS